jgi:hypothetical protein
MAGNEAVITMVAKYRDEAAAGLTSLGQNISNVTSKTVQAGAGAKSAGGDFNGLGANIEKAREPATRFRYETIALGAALSSVGSLINHIDSPATKMISNFMEIAGSTILTVSSIAHLLPYLNSLVGSLKNVALWQTIVKALSGPAGWLMLGGGIIAGVAAGYGISQATSSSNGAGVIVNNYIAGDLTTEERLMEKTRKSIINVQGRNGNISGIK